MLLSFDLESALALVGLSVWSLAWKGALLFAAAGLAARALSRRCAAARHVVWSTTAVCALLLPTLELVLPRWNLPQSVVPFIVVAPTATGLPVFVPTSSAPIERNDHELLVAMNSRDGSSPAMSAVTLSETASSAGPAVPPHAGETAAFQSLPRWSLWTWIGAVWSVGFLTMLVPLVSGVWSLSRLRRHGERIGTGAFRTLCRDTAASVGYRRPIEFVLSDRRTIPMTWGVLRPILLLPREALDWSRPRLRMVLLHELAHVQRGDCLSQILGQLMRAVHWFNPLAWWSLRKQRGEAEQACDDRVLSAGTDAADYAEQLVSITAGVRGGGFAPAPALGMGPAARLQGRVQAILDPSINRRPSSTRTASSILVAMLVITSATAAFDAVATGADDADNSAQSSANATSGTPQEQKSDQPPLQTTKQAVEPVAKSTDAAVYATSVKNETAESVTGGDAVSEVRDLIRKRYAGKKDEQALTEAAIRGLLQGLNDPYSEFLPQEKLRTFEQELQGSLAGIGAQLAPEKDRLMIVAPLPGSPAQKAGLQPRDAITAIDGKSARELTLEQAVQAIRGPVGTQVRLRITRANGNEEEIVVTRGNIQLPSVKGWSVDREGTWNHWLNKDSSIGYVRISEFRSRTAKEFESALQQLTGMKGLILDLRHNPGGQLTVVVEVAQMLLQQGTIVTVWVGEKQDSSYQAVGKAVAPSVPLLVLIDEKTASAAEILAGALKDNDRAVLLGARTFGKGSVQAIHQLAGQGAVKLTTAHFRLPSGRNIDRQPGATTWGVDPTDGYFVPLSTEEQATWQRIRAQKDLPATTPVEAPSMTEAALERDFADPQLAAAMKTLSARISQGAFSKTGRSEEHLRAYYERHDQLRRQREAALKALQEIDGEISKLAP